MPPSPTRFSVVTCHRATTLRRDRPEAEAVATHRAMAFARAADAPVYVVHLSCAAAMQHVADAKASGVRAYAETCPHYLTLTDERYDEPDALTCARCLISPPLRPSADQRRALGRPGRRPARSRRDRPRPRPARGREGRRRDRRPVRPDLERGSRDRDPPRDGLRRRRGEGPADDRADGRPAGDDAGATVRVRAQGRDRERPRRRHRLVRPGGAADDPGRGPPPHERLHAVRGPRRSRAPSARSSSAAGPSSRTASSSASAGSVDSSSEAPPAVSSGASRAADFGSYGSL